MPGRVNLKIYRRKQSGFDHLGDAVLVEGARPDVENSYPTYPGSSKAGWGYMLLTNFLPGQGNGTFTFHVIARDVTGHEVTLGTRTRAADNANAVKPFGAIDTPEQCSSGQSGKIRIVEVNSRQLQSSSLYDILARVNVNGERSWK